MLSEVKRFQSMLKPSSTKSQGLICAQSVKR